MTKRKSILGDIGKVFAFTSKMTVTSKSWKGNTIWVSALFLLLPVIIMSLITFFGSSEPVEYTGSIHNVLVVDNTPVESDYSVLSMGNDSFSNIVYTPVQSFDEAKEMIVSEKNGLILTVTIEDGMYLVDVVHPDETDITSDDISHFKDQINMNFGMISIMKSGLDEWTLTEMSRPVDVITINSETGDDIYEDSESQAYISEFREAGRMIVLIALPYVVLLFIYFFVMFYGQSAAQLVVLEKTSKLMDTVLVSVKPYAMIFGKMLACVACALLQMAIWLASVLLGLYLGGKISYLIDANTQIQFVSDIVKSGIFDGMFSPLGIIIAILITVSGCVMYCSLAAIGGALAGKQEDLQSSNLIFTFTLLISYLLTMFGGDFTSTGMVSSEGWMNYVPFTAVLITPSRVLTGESSIGIGLISLALIMAVSTLFIYIAGKLYKMMSFYKGKLPSVKDVFKMILAE